MGIRGKVEIVLSDDNPDPQVTFNGNVTFFDLPGITYALRNAFSNYVNSLSANERANQVKNKKVLEEQEKAKQAAELKFKKEKEAKAKEEQKKADAEAKALREVNEKKVLDANKKLDAERQEKISKENATKIKDALTHPM